MRPSSSSSTWRRLATEDGSQTLVSPEGHACHSEAGAWSQARERYAAGARLARHPGPTVRLLDVGTGLGLNLAAALEAVEGHGMRLMACGFELDPAPLEAAVLQPELAAGPWHASVTRALELALRDPDRAKHVGVPMGRASRLRLLLGDAREQVGVVQEGGFDAVFLDPFAPSVHGALWEQAFLAELGARLAPEGRLVTYSAATEVRVRLARAGLQVGRLGRVGRKAEGTVASRRARPGEELPERLARRILRRAEERGGPLTRAPRNPEGV